MNSKAIVVDLSEVIAVVNSSRGEGTKSRSSSDSSSFSSHEELLGMNLSGNVSLTDNDSVQSNPPAIAAAAAAALNNNSDNNDYIPGTFEGPEKTMEVVFRSDRGPEEGLRLLTRPQIDLLCEDARCTVVQTMRNQYIDSYVLSESSLFVYKHRLIMKTCGTTTLLRCLSRLFDYTDEMGMELAYLGYSRKNLTFPQAQDWLHQSFENEITYLSTHQKLENRLRGTAHVLGPITGDHWFVYVADHVPLPLPLPLPHPPSSTEVEEEVLPNPNANKGAIVAGSGVRRNITSYDNLMTLYASAGSNERTINLMMFDMAPEVSRIFYQSENGLCGKEMTEKAGIHHLVPGAQIDALAFSPCGYSMNAICHDAYSTIHITPEPACSYVSFETNTLLDNYSSLIRNVLNVFRPRRFVVTMFGDQTAIDALSVLPTEARQIVFPQFGQYLRTSASSTMVDLELGCVMACYSLLDPVDKDKEKDRAMMMMKAQQRDKERGGAGGGSPSTVSVNSTDCEDVCDTTHPPLPSPSIPIPLPLKERSNTWC